MVYDFGLRLKGLREKKKMTQEQVGKYLGVTGANVSSYEKNVVSPPIDVLRKLALLYGVTSDYILGIDDRKIFVIETRKSSHEKGIEQILEIIQCMLNE